MSKCYIILIPENRNSLQPVRKKSDADQQQEAEYQAVIQAADDGKNQASFGISSFSYDTDDAAGDPGDMQCIDCSEDDVKDDFHRIQQRGTVFESQKCKPQTCESLDSQSDSRCNETCQSEIGIDIIRLSAVFR